jgi:hypothetical protein
MYKVDLNLIRDIEYMSDHALIWLKGCPQPVTLSTHEADDLKRRWHKNVRNRNQDKRRAR